MPAGAMRYLEVRRHTMRTKPGQHLSQAGVDLARRIGAGLGPFDRVVTSTLPRAFETALALGFAVDAQYAELAEMGDDVDAEIAWDAGFAAWAAVVCQGGAAARFAQAQAALWSRIVAALPEGGSALLITHGGIVEAGAVASLPDADHAAWGPVCDYCEGVRLAFAGPRCTAAQIRRVGPAPR